MSKKRLVVITDFPLRGSSFATVSLNLFSKLAEKYDIDILSLGYMGLPLNIYGFRILPLDSAAQIGYYNKHIPRDLTLVFHSFYFLEKLGLTTFPSRSILYIPVETTSIPKKYRDLMQRFDRVLTPSLYSQDVIKSAGMKSDVVYHGVETEFFEKNNKIPKQFMFGFLGLNDMRKQIPKLVEAYSKLKIGDGHLVISTTAEGHYDIPSLYADHGMKPNYVGNKFFNLPSTPDGILDFYRRIKIYVQCSSESFGLPSLEAASCELPNIALDQGASPEILSDCALFVKPMGFLETNLGPIAVPDVESLTEAMATLVDNPGMRKELGLKGRKRSYMFNWSDAVTKLDRILEEEISIG
jgi:glycosyltransferase involved in cell wall biosynthesis